MFGRLSLFSRFALPAVLLPSLLAAPLADSRAADGPDDCDSRCVRVATTVARLSRYASRISLTGEIAPKFQSNIAFRVGGRIQQRLAEVGDHVTADQVIARLDPQEQTSNVDTAKAALASAQALLQQAKVAFARQETLFKSGYTTRASYDQAQQQLRTEQAAVDNATAALGTAREQYGYTDLKAGVAGIVTARNAEVGQVVQPGQTVYTIAMDGPRDAVFDIYEALLTEPPSERHIHVALQSDPSVEAWGSVREISPSVDASSGTIRLKVGLDTVPPRMSLGAVVVGTGEFKPAEAIVLPRGVLFRWNDAPAVWVLDPATHRAAPRVVGVKRYDGDRIVIGDGVKPGEIIVTAGIQFLYPGEKVVVAPQGSVP